MSDVVKKYFFLTYYLTIIFLSINNFNIKELREFYFFFDDKDKIMHFSQYFILVILALFTFRIDINIKNFLVFCLLIMISSGMAEFAQLYLPTRDSSYIDWSYDILGGACGFFFFAGINRLCYKN